MSVDHPSDEPVSQGMAVGLERIEQHRHFLFGQVFAGAIGGVRLAPGGNWSLFARLHEPQVTMAVELG